MAWPTDPLRVLLLRLRRNHALGRPTVVRSEPSRVLMRHLLDARWIVATEIPDAPPPAPPAMACHLTDLGLVMCKLADEEGA